MIAADVRDPTDEEFGDAKRLLYRGECGSWDDENAPPQWEFSVVNRDRTNPEGHTLLTYVVDMTVDITIGDRDMGPCGSNCGTKTLVVEFDVVSRKW